MTSAPGVPPPSPEAQLIRLAREASGLSPEEAADRTPIRLKGARWRQLERGYETRERPIKPKAKTLAHMAAVVGLTPERLAESGRQDAASILQEIQLQAAKRNAERSAASEAPGGSDDPRWLMLRAWLDAASANSNRRERQMIRRQLEHFLATNPDWQPEPGQPPAGDQHTEDAS